MTGQGTLQTRRYRIEWMLLGTALLILGALVGYWVYDERGRVEALERDRLQVQARVIDENLGRQLEGVNNALAGVRNDYSLSNRKSIGAAASRHLKTLADAMPGVRTMSILDAEGTVLASSRDELIGMNFSAREYFKVPRERLDPATLYVSPPFKTVLGVFLINGTRVATGSRGEFAGIVSAALDPEYFNVLLQSVLYAPDMWVSIAHGDGMGFLYMPLNERAAGIDLAKPGSFFSRHRDSGQAATVMTGTGYATGEELMMAIRTIRPANVPMDKPLVVGVGRDIAAIYAPWRKDALMDGGLYGAIALTAILGLTFSQRRQRKYDRLEADHERDRRESAERQKRALRASEAQFRLLAEENLAGVVIIQDGRFKYVNPARARMLGYSPEDMLGASSALEFVADEDRPLVQEHLRRRQDGEAPSMRYTFRGRRKDGSLAYFEVLGSRIDFDGRIAVMSTVLDVTERRLSEQELQRSAAELRTAYRRLAQVQDAERRAITKELHDQVGQNLSALNLNLHYIDRELSDAERARLKGRLDDSLVLLEETVARVRSVMGNLHPPMLDEFGLFATLRWLAHEVTHRSGIESELVGTDPGQRLPAEIESTLMRIAQEALMNAVKYSKARRITLALAVTERQVRLEIADDGVGFDLDRQVLCDVNPTWGLMTMRERAAAVGGLVHVASSPGAGTRVVAEIPREPA